MTKPGPAAGNSRSGYGEPTLGEPGPGFSEPGLGRSPLSPGMSGEGLRQPAKKIAA